MDRCSRRGPEPTALEAVGDQWRYALVVVQAADDDDDYDNKTIIVSREAIPSAKNCGELWAVWGTHSAPQIAGGRLAASSTRTTLPLSAFGPHSAASPPTVFVFPRCLGSG